MGNVKTLGLTVALVACAAILMGGAGTASATLLCIQEPKAEGGVLKCPEPGKWGYGVDVFPGSAIGGTLTGKATFESIAGPTGTVTCTESTFNALLKSGGTSNAGEGVTKTTFNSNVGKRCTATIGVNSEAEVVAENLSYDATTAEYEAVAAPQGNMTFAKAGGAVQIKIALPKSGESCIYQPEAALKGSWTNGKAGVNPSQLSFTTKVFKKTGGPAGCPTKERFSATYNLKAQPENVDIYIAKE